MSEEANNQAGGDEGGNQGAVEVPKWMSSLPDAFKSNETLAQYKDGAPWEKVVNLLGAEKSMIQIPGEKATDEEKQQFYAKLGRPEKVDGYEITKPADLPERIPYEPAIETMFTKFAFEKGLSKQHAKDVWDFYFNTAKEGAEIEAKNIEKAQEESVNALKTEWGTKFEGNKKIAEIAFKRFGKTGANLLDEAKVGNIRLGDHPAFLKTFYEIGIQTMDDKALSGKEGGRGQDSGDADQRAATLMFPSMAKKE